MDEPNPYEAPLCLGGGPSLASEADGGGRTRLYLAWAGVFALNMAFPLLAGWSVTSAHGRIGMAVACLSLLTLGGWVCVTRRTFAAPLIAGSAVVGLTQLVPILQFTAGLIGLGVGGLVDRGGKGDSGPELGSELGGFVVTAVTGSILIVLSAGAGAVLRLITPKRWWERSRR